MPSAPAASAEDGLLFAQRLLSRDAAGNLRHKKSAIEDLLGYLLFSDLPEKSLAAMPAVVRRMMSRVLQRAGVSGTSTDQQLGQKLMRYFETSLDRELVRLSQEFAREQALRRSDRSTAAYF